MVAVVFLYQITVFYNKTQQHHFWNFILLTQVSVQTVYAPGGSGGSGSQQREVADGADVVFTDTGN